MIYRNTKVQIEDKNANYVQENKKLLELKKKLNDVEYICNNILLKQEALKKEKECANANLNEITKYIYKKSQK